MRTRIFTFAIWPFLIAQPALAQGCGPLVAGNEVRIIGDGDPLTGRLAAVTDTSLEITDARSGLPLSLPATQALVLEKHCTDPARDGAIAGALLGTAAVALTYGTLGGLLDMAEDASGVETDRGPDRGPDRFVVSALVGAGIGALLGYSLDAARDGSRWARRARETRVGVAGDGSLRLGVTVAVRRGGPGQPPAPARGGPATGRTRRALRRPVPCVDPVSAPPSPRSRCRSAGPPW